MMQRERKINSQIIEGGLRKSIWKLALPMMVGISGRKDIDAFILTQLYVIIILKGLIG